MATYDEWRVTGTWRNVRLPITAHFPTEDEARAWAARRTAWIDGPHLHKRTVTVTEWEAQP